MNSPKQRVSKRKIKAPLEEIDAVITQLEAELRASSDSEQREKILGRILTAQSRRATIQNDTKKFEAKLVDSKEWRELSAKINAATAGMCEDCVHKLLAAIA